LLQVDQVHAGGGLVQHVDAAGRAYLRREVEPLTARLAHPSQYSLIRA
jgi:hypothetical protein